MIKPKEITAKCSAELPNPDECDATDDATITKAGLITVFSLINRGFSLNKTSLKNRTFAPSKKEVKRT